jgi:hypothetical protein
MLIRVALLAQGGIGDRFIRELRHTVVMPPRRVSDQTRPRSPSRRR